MLCKRGLIMQQNIDNNKPKPKLLTTFAESSSRALFLQSCQGKFDLTAGGGYIN